MGLTRNTIRKERYTTMKNNTPKEQALEYWIRTNMEAWTWSRLTLEEQLKFVGAAYSFPLYGSFNQRCEQLNGLYYAFLCGCGYDKTDNWREEKN